MADQINGRKKLGTRDTTRRGEVRKFWSWNNLLETDDLGDVDLSCCILLKLVIKKLNLRMYTRYLAASIGQVMNTVKNVTKILFS